MNCISLYSGADNLGDGFIQAGHRIKICVEQDKDCCETIRLNHPDIEVINKPVSEVLSTLPKVDCVIGGPPCPEFSRAKSNRSFDLCEVNNFRKAIEITKAKHHFMENVQDLYQVHNERNFLINCADYGVPQTRIRRIFTDLELPSPTHAEFPSNRLFGEPLKKWVSVKEALGLDGFIQDKNFNHHKRKNEGISVEEIPSNVIDTQNRHMYIEDRKTKYFDETEYLRYSVDKPHHTLITDSRDFFISNTGHNTQNRENITRSITEPANTVVVAGSVQLTNYPIKSIKKIRNKIILDKHPPSELEKTSVTITTKDRGWNLHSILSDGSYARKLTNEELAILQGFRKDFKFFGGKTSVRRQIGNALPAPVSKAFGWMIK